MKEEERATLMVGEVYGFALMPGVGVETERSIGMDEMGTGTTFLYLHLRKDFQ